MESSKDNPESFSIAGFPPDIMERKNARRATSKFPYVLMTLNASSVTWHEPFQENALNSLDLSENHGMVGLLSLKSPKSPDKQ